MFFRRSGASARSAKNSGKNANKNSGDAKTKLYPAVHAETNAGRSNARFIRMMRHDSRSPARREALCAAKKARRASFFGSVCRPSWHHAGGPNRMLFAKVHVPRPPPSSLVAFVRVSVVLVSVVGCGAGNNQGEGARPHPLPPAPRACTEIGCIDGLHVTLSPAESWPAGAYAFEIRTDAGSTSCRGSLPLPPCGTPALTCTGQPIQIGESGCALPHAAHGFSTITFSTAPKQVHVRITRDDQPVVERELQPVYRRVQPNGAGCDPVCTTASETVRVF
jgi:hypothetical protein